MNVIEIKNLTKLYGNGRGIKNLNLTVEQGDILGLLGPNGSGKTTAMKAILNLVNAEGSVKVCSVWTCTIILKVLCKEQAR